MGLLSEVKAATKRPTIPKWEQVRTALSDEDWAEFRECLADPAVPSIALEKVLKARGVAISDATIRVWRRNLPE